MAERASRRPRWRVRLRQTGMGLTLALAGRRARWLLVLLALVMGSYLLYTMVWTQLRAEVVLPQEVKAEDPQLDVLRLQEIMAAQGMREQHTRVDFSRFRGIFPSEREP